VALDKALLPYALQRTTVKILSAGLFLQIRDAAAYRAGHAVKLALDPPGAGAADLVELTFSADAADPFGGLPKGAQDYSGTPKDPGAWTITFTEADNAGAAAPAVVLQGAHLRLNPA
jgi:hypothetical protein